MQLLGLWKKGLQHQKDLYLAVFHHHARAEMVERPSARRKLFSTNEPIWIYSTSGPTQLRCLVDVVVIMERMSVNFTRSCYNRGYKVSRSLQGIFDERRKKHMDVKTSGPLFNFQEDLVFMSDDYSCAVVMTTTNVCGKVIRYDLRIRNAFIKKPPQKNCLKWFHKYEKHGTVRYDPSCQHILAHHGESKPYDEEQERCKATKLGIGLATLSNALAAKILRRAQKCCFDVPASAVSPRPCKTYHLDRATASNI
ncbi:uncharacterized protein LOC142587584 isoform X7 [Dermacentor variabilis]|uniref:uncharacterized protein LOC142587584 isoform X7 n=1 Tax=Dermacentor variabilis TaxID=34621 RepID=UPI003F5AE788